jgi:uncharacterized membrane-anchored protein
MRKNKLGKDINQKVKKTVISSMSSEERLKIIANIIVDRIIEDQQNGNLHLRTQAKE